jgi:hypothetical protein
MKNLRKFQKWEKILRFKKFLGIFGKFLRRFGELEEKSLPILVNLGKIDNI